MGQCGCGDFSGGYKFPGADGITYVLEVYPSCSDCAAPAGVTIHKMDEDDCEDWDVVEGPDLNFHDGMAAVPVFDLEQFRFIGITEDYENSINIFRKQFGLDNVIIKRKNVNPDKITGNNYEINTDLRALIYKNNQVDFEIYQKAIEINKILKRKYLD